MALRLLILMLLCLAGPVAAAPIVAAGVAPGLLCRRAIESAERGTAIPPHLLAAIGRVESGRQDPLSGQWTPWPWTVDAEGQGSFYDTKAEAVAAVRAMQARGIQSIDVGCMQVNLMHHPDAFPSLEMAFEPQVNAAYAARFLQELHAQTSDWSKATALYHSATPELGADYQRKVQAAWPEESRLAGLASASPLAQAWGATLASPPPGFRQVMQQQPPRRAGGGQTIMLPLVNGAAPPGRGLSAYRAAPITLAIRPPPRGPRG